MMYEITINSLEKLKSYIQYTEEHYAMPMGIEAREKIKQTDRDAIEDYDKAINALKKYILVNQKGDTKMEYKSEAEEYRTPKKPIKIMATNRQGIEQLCYDCPNCHWSVHYMQMPVSYCSFCGQAIDWTEGENGSEL